MSDKPSPETLARVMGEWRTFSRACAIVVVIGAFAVGAVDAARGNDFSLTCGWVLGSGLAAANVWSLARGIFAVMQGSGGMRAALLMLGGFTLLLGATLWIALLQTTWMLGFAFGIASPAAAGVVYAVIRTKPMTPT